jgi:hypothetical protein
MLLAVAVMLAMPEALVVAVGLDNVALAPVEGAVNVTVTPLTGFPAASFTVACSAVGKATPTNTDCDVPPVAVMPAGAPAVLVNENVAVRVPTVAVTA